jgi:glycosyltransferase involved in cell wall biosynthesis
METVGVEVSVVIPVYNEERHIKKCINSLLQQDYPLEKVEFIFVDGNSTDKTVEIIKQQFPKFANISLLTNDNRTVPYAMNMGIEQSVGKYIIRLDGHSEYPTNYLSTCVAYLEKTGADNVGGLALAKSEGYVGRSISAVLSSKFGVGNSTFRTGGAEGDVDTVPFGAFRREVFENYGLYDERLTRNQDIELNYRIRKNGGRVFFTPNIKLHYLNRDNLKDFARQNYSNGMWNVITWKLCPGSLSLRHFVPFAFVISLIFLPLLVLITGSSVIKGLFLFEIYLYGVLNVAFSVYEGARNDVCLIPFLPFVFFILHLSYGWGSLIGLIGLHRMNAESDSGKN